MFSSIINALCQKRPVSVSVALRGMYQYGMALADENDFLAASPEQTPEQGSASPSSSSSPSRRGLTRWNSKDSMHSGYAMVVQSVEKIDGEIFLVMRNSWGIASEFYLPAEEGCRMFEAFAMDIP